MTNKRITYSEISGPLKGNFCNTFFVNLRARYTVAVIFSKYDSLIAYLEHVPRAGVWHYSERQRWRVLNPIGSHSSSGRRQAARAATPGSVSVFIHVHISTALLWTPARDPKSASARERERERDRERERENLEILTRRGKVAKCCILQLRVEWVQICVNVGLGGLKCCCVERSCVWLLQRQCREQCTAAAAGIHFLLFISLLYSKFEDCMWASSCSVFYDIICS